MLFFSFPGQIFVWMNLESPWTNLYRQKECFNNYESEINLTMTYRLEISWNCGSLLWSSI